MVSVVFAEQNGFEITCELLPKANEAGKKLAKGDNAKIKAFYVGYMEADEDFGMPGDIKLKKGVFEE